MAQHHHRSVVHVVIFSACGLFSLALDGRLAALVARFRIFQREMLREQENWAREVLADQKLLMEVLGTKTLRVPERARLIRLALWFFLFAVALLIICRLTIALSGFLPVATLFAAALFVLGLLSMSCGVVSAMMEFRDSLELVEFRARFVFQAVESSPSDSRPDSTEI